MTEELFLSSVQESVSKSMQEGKILVVYNSNGDDLWLNSWFQRGFEKELGKHAVWLRLVRGTEQFSYFEQIFPSVEVPSFYLIRNGQILSTIQGEDKEHGFWDELTRKLNVSQKLSKSTVVPVRSGEKTLKEQASETAREKYNEQLLKEKASAQKERERILKLVKADRAERKALGGPAASPSATAPVEIHDNIKNSARLHAKTCTLLIKLTNGDNITEKFESKSTLNDVRKWVDAKRTDEDGPYAFHRNIPRITFTDSDELKSLEALELLPRSVLIVKPLDSAYQSLNVAEAKGPGLLGKVFSGISSWWASDNGRESIPPPAVGGEQLRDRRSGFKESSVDRIPNPDVPAGGIPASSTTNDEVNCSPHSSRIDSPVYSAHEYHLRHNPSELSLPSRCVTPNVYHFVNVDDDDKKRSTYNGNNVNLEKKKDDD